MHRVVGDGHVAVGGRCRGLHVHPRREGFRRVVGANELEGRAAAPDGFEDGVPLVPSVVLVKLLEVGELAVAVLELRRLGLVRLVKPEEANLLLHAEAVAEDDALRRGLEPQVSVEVVVARRLEVSGEHGSGDGVLHLAEHDGVRFGVLQQAHEQAARGGGGLERAAPAAEEILVVAEAQHVLQHVVEDGRDVVCEVYGRSGHGLLLDGRIAPREGERRHLRVLHLDMLVVPAQTALALQQEHGGVDVDGARAPVLVARERAERSVEDGALREVDHALVPILKLLLQLRRAVDVVLQRVPCDVELGGDGADGLEAPQLVDDRCVVLGAEDAIVPVRPLRSAHLRAVFRAFPASAPVFGLFGPSFLGRHLSFLHSVRQMLASRRGYHSFSLL